MAASTTNRNAAGLKSLAALLPPLIRPAFSKRSPAAARIMSDWPTIVGPDLASRTAPRRLSNGVLTLACDGPTALELQHLAGKLAERINVQIGQAQVRQVRFVQEPAPMSPQPPRRSVAIPAPIEGLPMGELGASLARLAAAIAAREGPL
jgi:hypothetical protein